MVRSTSALLFLSLSTSFFFLDINARDLSSNKHQHQHPKRLAQQSSQSQIQDVREITDFDPYHNVILAAEHEDGDEAVFEDDEAVVLAAAATLAPSRGTNAKCAALGIPAFDAGLMGKVKTNLANTGWDSWVSGTRMEALLEYDKVKLSVYNTNYYNNSRKGGVKSPEVNAITKVWLDRLPVSGNRMVMDGGAAGDEAAVGVGFINAGKTADADRNRYNAYAKGEINYLLKDCKRHGNGAISHRPPNENFQAWNDFVYMTPPFFAYWGAINNDFNVAQQAHRQIKAYRELLRDPSTNFWRHVSHNGGWEDREFWGTGMAWVAAGMSRVYSTYKYGPHASRLGPEMADLANWANEILAATFAHQSTYSGLLPNAYRNANSAWDETASSALLASAVYRLASLKVLKNEASMIAKAARVREGIRGALNKETGWMWAANPLDWYVKTDKSPESMAFVILMEAAARDYRTQIGC